MRSDGQSEPIAVPLVSNRAAQPSASLGDYVLFEERFNTEQLETYVKELGVEDYYAELTRV
ncbi:hypothetical protein [Natronosalvus rutilus]|uniref:Uncharacterized protein n=1 Tax=Natronosalvus rutilus TaxID=2953753 RepID=A0A9E7NDQ4_9EURY|nr:hypothetical protein [Natronosalvus rutilus]UTF55621.1 hypothetical protein NGM29_19675 [Natronosalvus rutilus]